MRRAGVFILLAGFSAGMPAVVRADTRWELSRRPVLVARPSEPETDHLLWALCRTGGAIEVRIGAEFGLTVEPGQPVALHLASAGRAATLEGVARKSDNFQMTAGVELVTEVTSDHPLFAVLRTGKPATVTGAVPKPQTLGGAGMKTAVERFLAACRGR